MNKSRQESYTSDGPTSPSPRIAAFTSGMTSTTSDPVAETGRASRCPAWHTPVAQDIVLLISHNALGGHGLTHAFLRIPDDDDSAEIGWIINVRGDAAVVPADVWSELNVAVSAARAEVRAGRGGSYSRPRYGSCPTDEFFEMGPADAPNSFAKFSLSGHMIELGEDARIQYYADSSAAHLPVSLESIPAAFTEVHPELFVVQKLNYGELTVNLQLKKLSHQICKRLLPSGLEQDSAQPNTLAVAQVLNQMTTIVRQRNLLKAHFLSRAESPGVMERLGRLFFVNK
ncbi:unnamed protein product [Mycena citricolor]|uniref:Uncharacterized protein n=1 Tax=Mycena citricolor TaxID=2018698 RepID=A0AAD2HKK4_9AGAR|nr:unnamed protein product [Mycena citricolor]